MGTAPATVSDEEIQREVLDELNWDARVQPNETGVAVKHGVVVLKRWVDSSMKKWAAEQAEAHSLRGVAAVADDIDVRLPSSAERTDADIAAAATRALEWDALVPIEKLDATVSKFCIHRRPRFATSIRSRVVVLHLPRRRPHGYHSFPGMQLAASRDG